MCSLPGGAGRGASYSLLGQATSCSGSPHKMALHGFLEMSAAEATPLKGFPQ